MGKPTETHRSAMLARSGSMLSCGLYSPAGLSGLHPSERLLEREFDVAGARFTDEWCAQRKPRGADTRQRRTREGPREHGSTSLLLRSPGTSRVGGRLF